MTRLRAPRFLLPALALALPLLASAAHAAPAPSPDSVAGVYAAVGCGLGIKFVLASGAWVIVTIALCAYMIFDALATPD